MAGQPNAPTPIQLRLEGTEVDHHRLHEAIHAAHILADIGASYEAARILEAIALQTPNTEAGEHARNVLAEWGLAAPLPAGTLSAEFKTKVVDSHARQRQAETENLHLRNLLSLGLYEEAASKILKRFEQTDFVPELVRDRFEIPENQLADWQNRPDQLANKLRASNELQRQYRRARFYRAIDVEVGELAEAYLHQIAPRKQREEREEEHHPLEKEEHERERDSDELPPLPELRRELLDRAAHRIDETPFLAQEIVNLIQRFSPDETTDAELTHLQTQINRITRSEMSETKGPLRHELFDSPSVHRYRLELSKEAQDMLREEPKQYVRGTFYADEERFENVGVRIKGGWGSFRPLEQGSKTAFTIKFNQFKKGQRFHGLRRIILNNAVQDASFIRETLGYQLFRKAGIPAPRTTHALLQLNDRPLGLYVQIEAVTKDYLKRWFGKGSGNLYEGPGDVVEWRELDLDSNQDREDRSDLRALARTIETADEVDPWQDIAAMVNLNSFANFIAMESFLHHWDGYHAPNNYRLYHDPSTGLFEFMPHGCDQLFEEWQSSVFHPQGGILGRALLQTDSGKARYIKALEFLLKEVWDETELNNQIATLYQRIRPHLASAPESSYQLMAFEETVYHVLRFVETRRYLVTQEIRNSTSKGSWRERRGHEDEFFEWAFEEWH